MPPSKSLSRFLYNRFSPFVSSSPFFLSRARNCFGRAIACQGENAFTCFLTDLDSGTQNIRRGVRSLRFCFGGIFAGGCTGLIGTDFTIVRARPRRRSLFHCHFQLGRPAGTRLFDLQPNQKRSPRRCLFLSLTAQSRWDFLTLTTICELKRAQSLPEA